MAVTGSLLMLNKPQITAADLQKLDKRQVNRFDRFAAGNYSKSAQNLSDIPFYTSFALPLVFLSDAKARSQAPQIYFLYAEAISLTGGLYALTAGLVNRTRPNVYGVDNPAEERLHKYANNSFFGGHAAATATATFFTAKVFHDLYPDSPWRPVVWGTAAAVPATVAYLRLKAGKHFLSDNLLGYGIGATIGILVPELHKNHHQRAWHLLPSTEQAAGSYFSGLALLRRF